jgi:hypothetical protein
MWLSEFGCGRLPPSCVRAGSGNRPRTALGIGGSGNNHSTPDPRALADFANGSLRSGSASVEIVTPLRSSGDVPERAADVSWRLQTTRQNWSGTGLRLRYLESELQVGDETVLRIEVSPTGNAPFTPSVSVANTADNTVTSAIDKEGRRSVRRSRPDSRRSPSIRLSARRAFHWQVRHGRTLTATPEPQLPRSGTGGTLDRHGRRCALHVMDLERGEQSARTRPGRNWRRTVRYRRRPRVSQRRGGWLLLPRDLQHPVTAAGALLRSNCRDSSARQSPASRQASLRCVNKRAALLRITLLADGQGG